MCEKLRNGWLAKELRGGGLSAAMVVTQRVALCGSDEANGHERGQQCEELGTGR